MPSSFRGRLDDLACIYCKEPLVIETGDGIPICGQCRKELNSKFQAKKKRKELKTIAIPMRKRRYIAPKGKKMYVPANYRM